MSQNWKGFNEVPKFKTWGETISFYRTRHPIVVGYVILCSVSTCGLIAMIPKMRDPLTPVKKYREGYLVIRPDDPKVKVIKTGPTGLDYFGGKYNG